MIKSRKLQLVMVLISACICAPVLGAEPNETKAETKFKISTEKQVWVRNANHNAGRGPIKPSHVAELFIWGNYSYPSFSGTEGTKTMLESSAGRSATQKQREFVATSDAFVEMGYGNKVRNYRQFCLYAVSQKDAKNMAEAFIEILAKKADAKVQRYEKLLNEAKERIIDIKKKLPEKQKQFKAAESKYKEIKDSRHSSFDGGEAYKNSRETMLEMDKMLDVLEIELAGILEKLKAIEWYRNSKNLKDRLKYKHFPDEIMSKLDQMYVEQMIERKSVKAREDTTLRIRNREKEFSDCYIEWVNLMGEVHGLERDLSNSEKELSELEEWLANPKPEMLPPKVYQDKVTIYPVR